MIEEDRILKMVLSDSKLSKEYNYNPDDYPDCNAALNSENAVVVAVAKIVENIFRDVVSKRPIDQKQLYLEIFDYLNNNYVYEN